MSSWKKDLASRIYKHKGVLDVFTSAFAFDEPCLNYMLRQNGSRNYLHEDYLSHDFYLVLPCDFRIDDIRHEMVGSREVLKSMSYNRMMEVALLNSKVCPQHEDKYMFGLLRASMVRAGWLEHADRRRKINFITDLPTQEEVDGFSAFILAHPRRYKLSVLETAALLVPLIVEFVFRTRGYRFCQTSPSALRVYEDLIHFLDCAEAAYLLPPNLQWNLAPHFVSLGRAYSVANSDNPLVPVAIKKRLNYHPVGTGLLRKTEELMKHVKHCWYFDEIQDRLDGRLKFIIDLNDEIMRDPLEFHPCREVYGRQVMSSRLRRKLDEARDDCKYIIDFIRDILCEVYGSLPWRQGPEL